MKNRKINSNSMVFKQQTLQCELIMRDECSLPLKRFTALAAEKELLRHRVIVVGFKQKPFVHFEIRRRERRPVPSQIFRRS